MKLRVFPDKKSLAAAASEQAASIIRECIQNHGKARIIAATGASQFEFLEFLIAAPEIDWKKVEMFHLDEYVGLPISHPASFRRYLLERLIQPAGIEFYHLLNGEGDFSSELDRIGRELNSAPIDVAFVGIGENGHLAFNDPPADFETEDPYLLVDLDEACRKQQLGEGWFPTFEAVPTRAISMSIRQILRSLQIICVVPDERKAAAVQACIEGEISPQYPASALRTHEHVTVYLDQDSASRLRSK